MNNEGRYNLISFKNLSRTTKPKRLTLLPYSPVLETMKPPMIAATGFNFFMTGSGSTTKFSSVVAPRRQSESFGPNITEQVCVSFSSGTVNSASPSSRRSFRPSARVISRVKVGSIPIALKRSSGIKLWNAPVSTQNSSSKNRLGSEGFATLALTLNMPVFFSLISSSIKHNLALGEWEVNRIKETGERKKEKVERNREKGTRKGMNLFLFPAFCFLSPISKRSVPC